jgi:hypothetical protein
MKKPDVAIIYNFNDKLAHLGGSSFGIKGEISYVAQFLISVSSIKENWNSDLFTYKFYVIHSEPFGESVRQKIENTGATLIHIDYKSPTYLRTFCFTERIECDYRLVLDNDTFGLSTPNFDFTKDILAGFGGCRYNKNTSDDLCNVLSLKKPNTAPISKSPTMNWNGNEYRKYYDGVEYGDIFPYFNCGALLIKNSLSLEFGNLLRQSVNMANNWAIKHNHKIWLQDFYGLCINHITNNWGVFETGFNFIINPNIPDIRYVMNNYKGKTSLIHYINCMSETPYGKLIKQQRNKLNDTINTA